MYKRIVPVLLSLLTFFSLASCSAEKPATTETKTTESKAEKPKPGENFYGYVNYDYLSNGQIPYGKNRYGTMESVKDELEHDLSKLIDQCVAQKTEKDSIEEMVKELYGQYIDYDSRVSAGVDALMPAVGMIEECKTTDELIGSLGVLYKEYGVPVFFSFKVETDLYDTSVNNLSLMNINTCGNMKEGFTKSDSGPDQVGSLIEETLNALKVDPKDARKRAEDAVRLVNEIMYSSLDSSYVNDVDKHYHIYNKDDLSDLYSHLDTGHLIKAFGFTTDRVMVYDVDQCRKVNELFTEDNLRKLKDYSLACLMFEYKAALPHSLPGDNTSLKNDEEKKSESAKEFIVSLLDEELGYLYARESFKADTKKAVDEMISELRASMKKLINNSERLSDDSKNKFIGKLENMKFLLGYRQDYSAPFGIVTAKNNGSLLTNVIAVKKGRIRQDNSRLNEKNNRERWGVSPIELEAVYDPSLNTVTIPAAMMTKTLFDPSAGKIRNYGRLGFIIAHEMNHAFDANGYNYDENGNYSKTWLIEKDQKTYLELSDRTKQYYSSYKILGIYPINGELTLTENIADLGAVQCLVNLTDKKEEQREIFTGIAENLASLVLVTDVVQQLEVDRYSPEEARVNAVASSMDQFYSVYDIEKTDKMYVAPEKRIKVW